MFLKSILFKGSNIYNFIHRLIIKEKRKNNCKTEKDKVNCQIGLRFKMACLPKSFIYWEMK